MSALDFSAFLHTSNHLCSMVNTNEASSPEAEMTIEELDSTRDREIKAKAVSGILLLLLKWFKRSRTSRPTTF